MVHRATRLVSLLSSRDSSTSVVTIAALFAQLQNTAGHPVLMRAVAHLVGLRDAVKVLTTPSLHSSGYSRCNLTQGDCRPLHRTERDAPEASMLALPENIVTSQCVFSSHHPPPLRSSSPLPASVALDVLQQTPTPPENQ